MSEMTPEMFEQLPSTRMRRMQEEITALRARLAEVEAERDEYHEAAKRHRDEVQRLLLDVIPGKEAALATARRDALEEAASVLDLHDGMPCSPVYPESWSDERLAEINRNLCQSHNTLLVDGSRWQARAERAEARLAEAEAALDSIEVENSITTNGNVWRFWRDQARETLADKKLVRENAYREGLEDAAKIADHYDDNVSMGAPKAIRAKIKLRDLLNKKE